ncbi:lipoate--protein ligase [Marinilabiliaceae bacterium JC017]|nr:lipoate--protein ligase [Marinilabiliaceae bacterium JC017]
MIGIVSNSNNPAYNLATEEYLLKNMQQNLFFLYVNSPSIIVGKHQNTLAEINLDYIDYKEIPVFRRLSGGGTVYHDYGNLNFCFITNERKGQLVNFYKYTLPILNALKKLSVDAKFGGRHDLLINGKKISGNASHIFKNRVMHHGTLLFNSNLDTLNRSLKIDPIKYSDKAIKSVRSEVTNIVNNLPLPISFDQFKSKVLSSLINELAAEKLYSQNDDTRSSILSLVKEKYETWDWNYGYSPHYSLKRRIRITNGCHLESQISVEKGIIVNISMKCNHAALNKKIKNLPHLFLGKQHKKSTVCTQINKFILQYPSFVKNHLLKAFF